MDIDVIKQNENANNGKYIHLYFNKEIGMYTAYGFSAYLITFVVEPFLSYSEFLQMPVALLKQGHVDICRQSLMKKKSILHSYYLFEMATSLPKDVNYEKWENKLKE